MTLKIFRERVKINPCFVPSLHLLQTTEMKESVSIRSLDLSR